VTDNDKLIANPMIVLREEFDDWAVLFDPDSGNAFGLNPVSVFIWKQLDGRHTVQDILEKLGKECADAPDDAETYVRAFLEDLSKAGLAGQEFKEA
jgi:SynChlorMet cassette protein ScmD